MTAVAYLDTTCLHDIVRALDHPNPGSAPIWSWKTATEASCALLSARNVRFPPSPTRDGVPSGALGSLLGPLGEIVGVAEPSADVVRSARVSTKQWATRSTSKLTAALASLLNDNPDFSAWLEWSTENVWLEHSQRLNGLFDPDFIPQTALALGVSREDLGKVWEVSANRYELKRKMAAGAGDPDFDLIRDAYIVSALIRGRYHDDVARKSGWQIMHHPIRNPIFPTPDFERARGELVGVTNTERYVSNILMAAAFSQRPKRRVETWVGNILVVREAASAGRIDLRTKPTDEIALDTAIRCARQLDLTLSGRRVEQTIGMAASLGVGLLTDFFVSGWPAVVTTVGLAASQPAVERAGGFSPRTEVAHRLASRKKRLNSLAVASPGQIRRFWRT